jgi:hypothetical protein
MVRETVIALTFAAFATSTSVGFRDDDDRRFAMLYNNL